MHRIRSAVLVRRFPQLHLSGPQACTHVVLVQKCHIHRMIRIQYHDNFVKLPAHDLQQFTFCIRKRQRSHAGALAVISAFRLRCRLFCLRLFCLRLFCLRLFRLRLFCLCLFCLRLFCRSSCFCCPLCRRSLCCFLLFRRFLRHGNAFLYFLPAEHNNRRIRVFPEGSFQFRREGGPAAPGIKLPQLIIYLKRFCLERLFECVVRKLSKYTDFGTVVQRKRIIFIHQKHSPFLCDLLGGLLRIPAQFLLIIVLRRIVLRSLFALELVVFLPERAPDRLLPCPGRIASEPGSGQQSCCQHDRNDRLALQALSLIVQSLKFLAHGFLIAEAAGMCRCHLKIAAALLQQTVTISCLYCNTKTGFAHLFPSSAAERSRGHKHPQAGRRP